MPDAPDTDDHTARATLLAEQLRANGHTGEADRLQAGIADRHGGGLLEALREACQSVLTAVEAIDPASYAAVEELRLDLDRRLNTGRTSG